ncbi:MAG: bifunctional oligoribonuclease/PAP phosphatase NrnA [Flavobacteriaceae bacterium]|nr:bifunctional oligoribonuclease/PAP phosphatase NrnA [Flavobacteriaceae bacterium]
MNEQQLHELKQLLADPKEIVVVPHRNPDGDAYGSCLALNLYLRYTGHKVTVVSPNDAPEFLKWLPGAHEIVIFEEAESKATEAISKAEVIFTLDFNALHRVGNAMLQALSNVTTTYVMIDHHEQPDDYAKITYSDSSMSSTCEMVYHLFDKLNVLETIDGDIATCLYTGILTDTGSFKYPSTTETTMNIAAKLMSKGIDHTRIHNKLYDTNSFNRLQLLGTALRNLRTINDCNTAYITLSQNEMSKYNFKKGDTEGFVNYGLSLKGIALAAIFIEDQKQGIIKISLRSKGTFSVNKFARNYFDGGGHNNAAGGRSELTLKETVNKFLKVLPQYKTELQESYED